MVAECREVLALSRRPVLCCPALPCPCLVLPCLAVPCDCCCAWTRQNKLRVPLPTPHHRCYSILLLLPPPVTAQCTPLPPPPATVSTHHHPRCCQPAVVVTSPAPPARRISLLLDAFHALPRPQPKVPGLACCSVAATSPSSVTRPSPESLPPPSANNLHHTTTSHTIVSVSHFVSVAPNHRPSAACRASHRPRALSES